MLSKKEINRRNRKRYWKDPESKRKRVRIWWALNKNERNANRRTQKYRLKEKHRKDALKLKVLSHYSKGDLKCACCGETNIAFLSLDHVNGGGNIHRRHLNGNKSMGNYFYYYLFSNNFPEEPPLQVLCYNCNHAKAHLGYCPHQRRN